MDASKIPGTTRGYVMARGVERQADYRFLGVVPADMWWLRYRPHTRFEAPTLLVEAEEHSWRLLATLPSQRRDAFQRAIRYTLVLEADAVAEDRHPVFRLIHDWLSSYDGGDGQTRLGAVLDKLFPDEEVVDLRARRDDKARRHVHQRVDEFLAELGSPPALTRECPPGAWFASARTAARGDFMARVHSLLTEQPIVGRALVLNLPESIDDAPTPDPGESLYVLAVHDTPARPLRLGQGKDLSRARRILLWLRRGWRRHRTLLIVLLTALMRYLMRRPLKSSASSSAKSPGR